MKALLVLSCITLWIGFGAAYAETTGDTSVNASIGGNTFTTKEEEEAHLKRYFESKTVTVKISMPATKEGVDVHPEKSPSIDHKKVAKLLGEYGTAKDPGNTIAVTEVKVKDEHIEFQLGGGGYGTFGDETRHHRASAPEKTNIEKRLEKELKAVTDKKEKRQIEKDLDDLRKIREREYEKRKQEAIEKDKRVQKVALMSGSRFNIRYSRKLLLEDLTPEAVMRALAECVEFPVENFPAGAK